MEQAKRTGNHAITVLVILIKKKLGQTQKFNKFVQFEKPRWTPQNEEQAEPNN